MKQLITTLMLCIALNSMGQQVAEEPKVTKEWSFNVILLPNILLGNNINLPSTSNLISYKSIKENGNTFRLGFEGFYGSKKGEISRFRANLSLGYEKQRKISPHWITSVGVDIPLSVQAFDCSSNTVGDLPCTFWSFGIGGIWGLQWMINERVGIHTEGGIYYNYLHDNDDEIITNSFNFVLPRSLYLGVRF